MCIVKADSKLKVFPLLSLLRQAGKFISSVLPQSRKRKHDRKAESSIINIISWEMVMGWLPALSVLWSITHSLLPPFLFPPHPWRLSAMFSLSLPVLLPGLGDREASGSREWDGDESRWSGEATPTERQGSCSHSGKTALLCSILELGSLGNGHC